eukprot:2855763-Rhodomonas_salina.2
MPVAETQALPGRWQQTGACGFRGVPASFGRNPFNAPPTHRASPALSDARDREQLPSVFALHPLQHLLQLLRDHIRLFLPSSQQHIRHDLLFRPFFLPHLRRSH